MKIAFLGDVGLFGINTKQNGIYPRIFEILKRMLVEKSHSPKYRKLVLDYIGAK